MKKDLLIYCMSLKANWNYILKDCGDFPRIFYINKLFVHSINLEYFKATVCIKDETGHFGWQNSILTAGELSRGYVNVRELMCLYGRGSSSQKRNLEMEHPHMSAHTHLPVETKWAVLAAGLAPALCATRVAAPAAAPATAGGAFSASYRLAFRATRLGSQHLKGLWSLNWEHEDRISRSEQNWCVLL